MGYGYRFGTQIQTYWPDDDETTLYLSSSPWDSNLTLADIIQQAKDHFGEDVKIEDVAVSSEYIHTDCLTYDLYDAGDYTNFIVLRKIVPNVGNA